MLPMRFSMVTDPLAENCTLISSSILAISACTASALKPPSIKSLDFFTSVVSISIPSAPFIVTCAVVSTFVW